MRNQNKLDALDKLIAAVESGRLITISAKDVCSCVGWEFPNSKVKWFIQAERGSLDAALSLHNALLPRWEWKYSQTNYIVLTGPRFRDVQTAESDNPARAWLIAILKAYRSLLEAEA